MGQTSRRNFHEQKSDRQGSNAGHCGNGALGGIDRNGGELTLRARASRVRERAGLR